jgi:hypothetical protein
MVLPKKQSPRKASIICVMGEEINREEKMAI